LKSFMPVQISLSISVDFAGRKAPLRSGTTEPLNIMRALITFLMNDLWSE